MPPRLRPNAFEVSFPDEVSESSTAVASSGQSSQTTYTRSTSLKRTSESLDPVESRETKRQQLPPVAYYHEEHPDPEIESPDLILTGEDPFGDDDDDEGNGPQKPVRVLTNFTIFDPRHRNEMVSLAAIEEDDGVDRQFEGAGVVFPYFTNEEDEGQEEDEEEGEEDNGKFVRLGAILRYTFDYTQDNDPVWIETIYSWYILRMPSREYTPYFQHFYGTRRIAQMVISSVTKNPNQNYDDFRQRFTSMVDAFGRTYLDEHLLDAIPEIQQALENDNTLEGLKSKPLVRRLFRRAPPASPESSRRRPQYRDLPPTRPRLPPPIKSLLGADLDLAVLKAENQTQTHVTPLIASLAHGLVHEELFVVGGRPPPQNKALAEAREKAAHARLRELIKKARVLPGKPKIDVRPREDYIKRNSRYLKSVRINGEMYQIGDFVVVTIGTIEGRGVKPPGLPDDIEDVKPTHTIADYFWFARILYGDIDRNQFHVQWLEHSSHTMLEELGHSQELFYNDLCNHIHFKFIVSKVTVHEASDSSGIKPEDFFVKFLYDPVLATFTSIDKERLELASHQLPPHNCPICPLVAQQTANGFDRQLKDKEGINGVAYGGDQFHLDDFVLYRGESGPARIGYVRGIHFPSRETAVIETTLTMQLVGRISTLPSNILPDGVLRDERHVFLTDETKEIPLQSLICVCFVFPHQCIRDLEEWLWLSPYHFYIKYTSPSLHVKLWSDLKRLSYKDLSLCMSCVSGALQERLQMKEFLAFSERHPLPTVDLFGGVAAFSMGLAEGSGCLKVTDSIEKSPSAALTTKLNHPDVAVHNQCANVMMRYSIKVKEGHATETPKQIFDEVQLVPGPIKAVKCLVAGFPCQSHSRLNMYRRADDIKSNLILNTLSWVDHLRPDLCYFENVPGFLGFSFDAVQAGMHKLEGGTEMGGLKFLVRALGDMGYQVRFGLLQAAHYGAPQRRSRFFLIAAVDGHPLPELPQPSHDFPNAHGLAIKLPVNGRYIRPIRSDNGTAPHPMVTIQDAISDLPRFDWYGWFLSAFGCLLTKPEDRKHPNLARETASKRREVREREQTIPTFACGDSSASVHCGFHGVVPYHHPPKTTYQLLARVKPTANLQQFTRCFPKKKVERVVSIPLVANADYRDLRPDQQEWQTSHPLSAVARKNYRPGLYGRLDENACFPTTVTNMEPTAKQSKVLNPWCKRMVTVRELARSQGFPDHFVFKALNNNVVTMHRQIGNAVPLQVGAALGRELRRSLYKKWLKERQDVIVIDDD